MLEYSLEIIKAIYSMYSDIEIYDDYIIVHKSKIYTLRMLCSNLLGIIADYVNDYKQEFPEDKPELSKSILLYLKSLYKDYSDRHRDIINSFEFNKKVIEDMYKEINNTYEEYKSKYSSIIDDFNKSIKISETDSNK